MDTEKYFFDHIYAFIKSDYIVSKNDLYKQIYNFFYVPDDNRISIKYVPENKVIHEIYNTIRQNKIIVDYFNTFNDGDFIGKEDFNDTLFKLNHMKQAYELGYKNILFLDFTYPNNFLKTDFNTKKNIFSNLPTESDGFIYLNYLVKPNIIKESINDYFDNVDVSTSMKFITACSISRRAIKNMLDNQEMIPKRFEYYLVHRNMAYDSLLDHIAFKKDSYIEC